MAFRKRYETEADRQKEREVMEAIEAGTGYRCVQMPERYPADILVFDTDGRTPRSMIEVKARNIAFGTYGSFHLSVEKVIGLRQLFSETGVPQFICPYLTDGIYLYRLAPADRFEIEYGGRSDRGDPEDREPVCCIPWDYFKALPGQEHRRAG